MPKRASTPKPTPTSTPTPTPTPTPARGAVTRYIALLRGINVGCHRVSMVTLRDHFSALGLARVETYIASENVLFEVPHNNNGAVTQSTVAALESTIEAQLKRTLGYAVSTFLRTPAELVASLAALPFDAGEVATEGYRVHIGFLRSSPAPGSISTQKQSTMSATAVSDCPTPTVSMMIVSKPAASQTSIASRVPSAESNMPALREIAGRHHSRT